ncbi:hypothetical protein RSAG8_01484, partial [Rhizoctonia solani AG-8 WAC10335]
MVTCGDAILHHAHAGFRVNLAFRSITDIISCTK